MKNPAEDLIVDADGIPILTDLIHEDISPGPAVPPHETRSNKVSSEELAKMLLHSNIFRQQLNDIATELTRTVSQQIELGLRSTLEEVISQAVEDSSTALYDAVREQLEKVLPDLLACALQK
jgi:hypothetical protein